jgi:hypothetical protein
MTIYVHKAFVQRLSEIADINKSLADDIVSAMYAIESGKTEGTKFADGSVNDLFHLLIKSSGESYADIVYMVRDGEFRFIRVIVANPFVELAQHIEKAHT